MLNIRSSEGSTKMGVCVCVSLCVFLLDMSFFRDVRKVVFFVPGAEEESVPPPRTACS